MEPREPKRECRLARLDAKFRVKVLLLLQWMRDRGCDPEVFETRRSRRRQEWLYGIGRTHHLRRRPVTWARVSRHEFGVAVDIISESGGWSDPRFFGLLSRGAERFGLESLEHDQCHVQIK